MISSKGPCDIAGNLASSKASNVMTSVGGAHLQAEQLIRVREGDRAAYGQVVLDCQNRLFNAMLRMVGDRETARELTQETFLRGLANLNTFQGKSSAYTWLFRIGMNLAIGQLRKDKRRKTFSIDATADDDRNSQAAGLVDRVTASATDAVEKKERDRKVMEALNRVDAEYRAILVMRDVEGMEYAQISEVLELPLGTVKSRLFRARLALRQELMEYMKGSA
jgi:RNA polymerase sigma-70 factor, ECF subfamily